MNKICILFFLLTLSASTVQSQSIQKSGDFSKSVLTGSEIDTVTLLSDQPLKSPMGAVLRSAVLPGWGQIYNEKHLKGAFVFSVNSTFAYAIYYYNRQWRDTGRTKFRDKRNLYTWYLGVSYLLTLVDAYVDAYLFGFEKAIEISAIETNSNSGRENFTITVSLKFGFN